MQSAIKRPLQAAELKVTVAHHDNDVQPVQLRFDLYPTPTLKVL
jgi:hypothetical protein